MSSRRPFLKLEDGYTKYADLKARYDELSAKHQSVKRKRTEERRELAKLRKRTKGVAEQFDSTLIDDSDSDEIHHEQIDTKDSAILRASTRTSEIELLHLEIADLKSDQDLLKSTISQNEALSRDRDVKDEQNKELRTRLATAMEQIDKDSSEKRGLSARLAETREMLEDTSEKLKLQTEFRKAIQSENSTLKEEIQWYERAEIKQKLQRRELASFVTKFGISRNDFESDSGEN